MVESAADYKVVVRFFYRTSAVMAVLVLLLAFPFNNLILKQVLGIADDLRMYIVTPLAWCAIFPLFYGATNLLRAHFTGSGQTLVLGQATILKFAYLLLCWLLLPLISFTPSGIALAIFLLISSECVEGLFLRWQRKRV
jgi:Na+-driven multidrug efflux pump